ncbi:MAG: hypothetical protein RLZZ86_409 [Cyanobacteriota bacterium]|jgi:hypothetical protein
MNNKQLQKEISKIIKGNAQQTLCENIFNIPRKNLKAAHHVYNYLYENNKLSQYNVIAEQMKYPSAYEMSSMIKPEYNMTLQAEQDGFEKNDYLSDEEKMGDELSKLINTLLKMDLFKTAEVSTDLLTAKKRKTNLTDEIRFFIHKADDPTEETIGVIIIMLNDEEKPSIISYNILFQGKMISDKINLETSTPF